MVFCLMRIGNIRETTTTKWTVDQVYVMFDLYEFGAGNVGACIRLGKTESLCNCNIFKLYGFGLLVFWFWL